MLSEMGRRPMIGNNDNSFVDDLEREMGIGMLLHEQRRQDADDLEKELNLYRSGSAPPTVEGSLSAVGGLFNHGGGGADMGLSFSEFARNKGGNAFLSEEELRSDPSYLSYYYSNANLNPRLPQPLMSRENWKYAQRLQGGGSAIGDRRKLSKTESGKSLFSNPPGFNSKKQESENEEATAEWGSGGLVGLPGIGLGAKQKSIAEIFQDDLNRSTTPVSGHPSRPVSRNAFDENTMASAEDELAHLRRELTPADPILSGGPPASYSYAAVLGASLSRTSTPDPQRIARVPSPSLTPIGVGRVANSEKRNINSPNHSFNNGTASHPSESADLAAALSAMKLSNGVIDEENHRPGKISPSESRVNNSFHTEVHRNGVPSNHSSKNGYMLSPYPHLDSPNSSYSNYGMSGYPMSPIAGQLGSPNLPPLFENAAAAALDPRMLGASNYGAFSASEKRMGNQMMQSQYIDPLYLQYLAVAAQVEHSNDINCMGNSYVDLLQKAYLGNLLSSQKSPYGGGSSPHGYYGNPAFGMGMSYPGSPLSSPGGPNSPMRHHGDINMRYTGGMRNGSPWHLDSMDVGFGSTLLEEFKSNKTRCFELSEIAGHVVEFSADQYGSRFIQQKLETATTDEKKMVYQEIFPQALTLMTDVFGNYVIQKFFEHGLPYQRRELAEKLFTHVLTLSLQMYGCRVIQKAIEVVDVDQKIIMVQELDGQIMRCVRDQNGNHVIQKCIECVPEEHIQFIITTFFDQVVTLSTHPYGCRVVQRVLEHCEDEKTQIKVMDEILASVSMLAQDQYGNYVVQHVLEHGKPHERSTIIQELAGKIVQMSQQKFASNVVEKCLAFSNPSERQLLVNEMLGTTDENEPLQAMMKDQFANYVVQKVLETCSDQHRELILSRIKVHLNALKKYTYGKHIVARVEKLVAAGERRSAAQSHYSAA